MAVEQVHRHSFSKGNVVTRYATLDIETSGIDPSSSQTVAIGIGTYDALLGECSVDVLTYGGALGSESALIRRAFERINEFDPRALVTFNGESFDLDFLDGRIGRLGFDDPPSLACAEHHIDLFVPRKRRAEEADVKWPSLEEVLEAHDMSVPTTEWDGRELTNAVFGESLAPEYIDAVDDDRTERVDELESRIYEYTATDVEANIALYEVDVGRGYPLA